MANFDFPVAFSWQDYPPILLKRIPKIVVGRPKKFHVDLHRICLRTGHCNGFPTGEGVRSPIVLSKFHSVVMHSALAHMPFQFLDNVLDSGNRRVD
jgi:hypothetical protein